MKNYFCKLLFILFFVTSPLFFTQNKEQEKLQIKSEEVYKELSEAKSGNWKDVLTDFMQLALKDLTGEEKSFQFKTTIFSIKAKADTTLLTDYKYVKEKFSRNFQIGVSLNLNNDYKFKGFSYGFDWAVINQRDLSVAKLSDSMRIFFQGNSLELMKVLQDYEIKLKEEGKSEDELNKLVENLNNLLEKGQYIPRENLPESFLKLLPSSYTEKSIQFEKSFNEEIEKIKRQPLLTLGFYSKFQKDSKFFDEFNANVVYLQGLKTNNGSKMEIDFRNQFNSKDSVTVSIVKRQEFSSQLGLNISILRNKDNSLIEFKPNFEFKRVFSGLMDEEKNNQFLANADLRFRVLKDLWIPLVLKYDIVNNNFFGFLNVSFNFDAIKNE